MERIAQAGCPYAAPGQVERVRTQDLGIGSIFEGVPDAVVVAHAQSRRIVLFNPAAERMFGHSASEALVEFESRSGEGTNVIAEIPLPDPEEWMDEVR